MIAMASAGARRDRRAGRAGLARGAASAAREQRRPSRPPRGCRGARGTAYRPQLDHQQIAYRGLAAQARHDQASREERERREQSVLRALAPVHETLSAMQARSASSSATATLSTARSPSSSGVHTSPIEALRATTESLGRARCGRVATRGVWGETQLRRVVEAAGLTRHVDFDLQHVDHVGCRGRPPDMIIRLPGEKAIAVDAKVPLEAYLEASAIR